VSPATRRLSAEEFRELLVITYEAVLPCPSCGHETACRWPEDQDTAAQQCGACGHVFDATWPGFDFEPEVVIVRPRGQEPGRGAA
jgi:transcription elongation factor Elf1